jgi:hypothetical protein
MKKNQILMATGAVVLALGGVLVGKASAKFANPTALYYTAGVGVCRQLASSITVTSNRLTTTAGTTQAQLKTSGAGAGLRNIYATINCSKKVYFNP